MKATPLFLEYINLYAGKTLLLREQYYGTAAYRDLVTEGVKFY